MAICCSANDPGVLDRAWRTQLCVKCMVITNAGGNCLRPVEVHFGKVLLVTPVKRVKAGSSEFLEFLPMILEAPDHVTVADVAQRSAVPYLPVAPFDVLRANKLRLLQVEWPPVFGLLHGEPTQLISHVARHGFS